MEEPVKDIFVGDKQVILVGTAHVSKKSKSFVKKVISEESPDAIGVELCDRRYRSLMKKHEWDNKKLLEVVRRGDFKLLLYQTLLYWFQQKIGVGAGVMPGSEMLEAVRVAKRKKLKLYLVDRDINETMSELINSMSIVEKLRVFEQLFSVIFLDEKIPDKEIEELKSEQSVDSLISELGVQAPNIKKVLVDDRNKYIAGEIRSIPEKKVVVFLGAGHVRGVGEELGSGKVFKKKKVIRKKGFSWTSIIPWTIILFLLFGFFKSPSVGGAMLLFYLASVMIGALVGGLVSLAHPLSILAGVFSAPITVLHPFLTSGMFAAVFQARQNPPRVKDLHSLTSIKNVRQFYGNGLSRLLLVFLLVNFFTSLGALVVFPFFIKTLI